MASLISENFSTKEVFWRKKTFLVSGVNRNCKKEYLTHHLLCCVEVCGGVSLLRWFWDIWNLLDCLQTTHWPKVTISLFALARLNLCTPWSGDINQILGSSYLVWLTYCVVVLFTMELLFYCVVMLCYCGVMCYCGVVVLKCCGVVLFWYCDIVVLWLCVLLVL